MTSEEQARLFDVCGMLDRAREATALDMTAEGPVSTGWPGRIQAAAKEARALMRERGRFSEDVEEAEPSSLQRKTEPKGPLRASA